jgi:hypothetical protein
MSSRKRSAPILKARRQRSLPRLLEDLEARIVLSQTTIMGPVAPTNLGTSPVVQAPTAVNHSTAPGTQSTVVQPLTRINPIYNNTDSGPGHIILPIQILGAPKATPDGGGSSPDQSTGPNGYSPQQLQQAYGISSLKWNGTVAADGAGETIAVIDVGNNPSFVDSTAANFDTSALAEFDKEFGLPNPPSFTEYNGSGGTVLPNPATGWGPEIALDIEWAHSIAPAAAIDVVYASTASSAALLTAANTAATKLDASVVSMSFGASLEEYGYGYLEQQLDATYLAPALAADPGVTFLASTGDHGDTPNSLHNAAPLFPSVSPLVIGVGGTTLNLTASNNWQSEAAWGYGSDSYCATCASGGGISNTFTQPAYQVNDGFSGSKGMRTIPDVASDADPSTGVSVYDPYDFGASTPWGIIGGTSLASPTWAGLVAIADQGRQVEYNNGPLDGPNETLPALYGLMNDNYSLYFHDITTGFGNGYNVGPGYDLVTGIGSDQANNLLPALAAFGVASKAVITVEPPTSVISDGYFGMALEAESSNGAVDIGFSGTATVTLVPGTGPTGASFTPVTVDFKNGIALFNTLQLPDQGVNYQLEVAAGSLPTVDSTDIAVTGNTAGNPTNYYPLPFDSSLRFDLEEADSVGTTSDVYLVYDPSTLPYQITAGPIELSNTSNSGSETINIIGDNETNAAVAPLITGEDLSRLFEIFGSSGPSPSITVTIGGPNPNQGVVLEKGRGTDTGGLTLPTGTGIGGALLIEGGSVLLSHVTMRSNEAVGSAGGRGSSGASIVAAPGGVGGGGRNALGGAIYMSSGSLTLNDDNIHGNVAQGGAGGTGGTGGLGGTRIFRTFSGTLYHPLNKPGGVGGTGGQGGAGSGGAIFIDGGNVTISGGAITGNSALGGAGGMGGVGGHGGFIFNPGGFGGLGGNGGAGNGGGVYLAKGSLTLTGSADIKSNIGLGAGGGMGGTGGSGGASGSFKTRRFGPAGSGGDGGKGGIASGGGLYVINGTVNWTAATLELNSAAGGEGGAGGVAGRGFGGAVGTGGFAGSGDGGGVYDAANITLNNAIINDNTADYGGGIDVKGTLTLTNGELTGNVANVDGGGVDIAGTLTITGTTFTGNTATYGGAIESSGTLTVNGGSMTNNSAVATSDGVGGWGGGIYSSGNAKVSGTQFMNNTAVAGGGIFSFKTGALGVASGSTFMENTAEQGGAIVSEGSSSISASTFSGNTANGAGAQGGGGAIFNYEGTAIVTGSTFANNTSDEAGGAIESYIATLTITGASAAPTTFSGNIAATSYGGAIDSSGLVTNKTKDFGTLALSGVSLTSNSALYGGGIFSQGALALSNGSAVKGNQAGVDGGGILNEGALNLNDSMITANSAGGSGSSGMGGGIYERGLPRSGSGTATTGGGAATITASSVAGNSATSGGGIFLQGGALSIENTPVSGNIATTASGQGGGIYNAGGTATVSHETLTGNSAGKAGGAIYNTGTLVIDIASLGGPPSAGGASNGNVADSGGGLANTQGASVTITDATFSYNTATIGGGAIDNVGTLSATNTTIAHNTATAAGGGIDNSLGKLTTVNVTIAYNSVLAGGQGGGIDATSGTVLLYNTIVAENANSSGPSDLAGTSYSLSSAYNLIGVGGTGNLSQAPAGNKNLLNVNAAEALLGPLGNYGGPEQTIPLLDNAGGTSFSEAIDHGSTWIAGVVVPTTDERGALRGPTGLNAGPTVDIGAYEASSEYLVTSTTSGVDYGTLAAAVQWANTSVNDNPENIASPKPNTVIFDIANLFSQPQTITLLSPLVFNAATPAPEAISYTGSKPLTISGGGTTELFQIDKGTTVTLSGLILTAGSAENGGAIDNAGTLSITSSTVTGNNAVSVMGQSTTGSGGAIQNETTGMLTISGSTFSNNDAAAAAGAINNLGTVLITDSTFSGNQAPEFGAIANTDTLTVTGSTFSNNSATAGPGGAIDNASGATATIEDGSTLSGNTAAGATGSGGAVENLGTLTISDSTVSGNSAATTGGAADNAGLLKIIDSTVANNTAQNGGAIANELAGTLNVQNSTLAANTATTSGGAVDNLGSATTLNTTLANNTAQNGGAFFTSGTLTTVSTTIAYNSVGAGGNGGGLDVSAGTTTLYNTIVAQNEAGPTGLQTASDITGTVSANSAYNLIGTGGSGGLTANSTTHNLVGISAPGLAPGLANNGGPTETIALNSGSPAINAGSSKVPGALPVDQRGAVRGSAGAPAYSGSAYDIGAYEASSEYIVTLNSDSTDIGTLRGAILWANVSSNADPSNVSGTAPNTIEFAPSAYSTGTISLTAGVLSLSNTSLPIVIVGPGAGSLAISGSGLSGVFSIGAGTTVSMTGLLVTDGSSAANGGGIDNSGTLTLTNMAVSGNTAVLGGGVANEPGSVLTLTDSTVSGNTATSSGGGVWNAGSTTSTHDTYSANTAATGGGIANAFGGSLSMSDSVVSTNSSTGTGGGIDNTGSLTALDSTVGTNTAATTGGGIDEEFGGSLSMTNVTVAANSAGSGGGIAADGPFTAINVTIADNSGSDTGAGGGLDLVTGGTATLYNTIVGDNVLGSGVNSVPSDIAISGTGNVAPISSYNLIGPGGSGNLINGSNNNQVETGTPKLGLDPSGLENNGGPTPTIAIVSSTSPALDKGSDSIPGVDVPVADQRGAQRGPAGLNAGTNVDVGAYEASSSYLVTTTADTPDVGSIRTAISWADLNTNVNPANVAKPAANTIRFDTTGVFSAPDVTIVLTAGPLVLSNTTTPEAIDGSGTVGLSLSAGGASAVLSVSPGATASIKEITITGGSATAGGGGIDNHGTLTVNDSTVTGNTSTSGGGGIDNEAGGTLTVENSTIVGNTGSSGGGISNAGTAIVINATITGNLAVTGAGIDNTGTLAAMNDTIAYNAATTSGGGLAITGGTATLDNTIVALNTAGALDDISGTVSPQSSFNLVDDATSAGGLVQGHNGNLVGVSPGFSPAGLASNGGPTQTIALVRGSAALNAASAAASISDIAGTTVTAPLYDQRGALRNPDNLTGGTTIDIGAFELSATYLVTSAADTSAGGTLRAAIAWVNTSPASAGPAVIRFDPTLFNATTPQTITLSPTLGTLALTNTAAPIEIEGPSTPGVLTLSGGGVDQILSIASGVTATITGVTFTAGAASTVPVGETGTPPFGGGGAIISAGNLTLSNDSFTANESLYYGGAVYNYGGVLTVTNSTFTNNQASYGLGGAIDNYTGTLSVTGSTFTGGYAFQGGAIDNKSGTTSIATSTFNDNTATEGGGFFNDSVATISSSTFSNNSAFTGGGIANDLSGFLYLINSTVADNYAGQNGGGINEVGVMHITNSTIAYNSVAANGTGGGIDASSGTTGLNNTIVAENTSATAPSSSTSSATTPTGTTTTGTTTTGTSTTGTTATPNNVAGTLSPLSGYNLVGTGGTGGLTTGVNGNLVGVASPGLGVLADNGGPTQTIALLQDSPALDAGSNALAVNASGNQLAYDQRGPGFPRIVNSVVDIGSFEQSPATSTTITSSANPAILGQLVTFTITVSPAQLNSVFPGGTVTLMNGSTPLAVLTIPNVELLTAGSNAVDTLTYSTSTLPLGTDVITAVYSGTLGQYAPSTSSVLSQVVSLPTTPVSTPTSTVTTTSSTTTSTASRVGTVTVAAEHSKKNARRVLVAHKSRPSGGSVTRFHHQTKPAAIKHSQITAVAHHAKVSVKKK